MFAAMTGFSWFKDKSSNELEKRKRLGEEGGMD